MWIAIAWLLFEAAGGVLKQIFADTKHGVKGAEGDGVE